VTNGNKIKTNQEVILINKSAITIFDSIKTISEFTNHGPKSFQFFVHIPKATMKEITASINEIHSFKKVSGKDGIYNINDRGEIIHFQNFIVDEGKFIKLFTFEWFTEKSCNKKKITEINRFDKKIRKWKSSRFVIQKFKNFHGCKLTFGAVKHAPESFINGNKWDGFLLDIFKDLAKAFNFKLDSVDFPFFKSRFKPLQMMIVNSCLPPTFSDKIRPKHHLSHPYFSATELLAVSPGEEYSRYEKLLLPFDYITWFLIGFTFVAAYSVILIINYATVNIRNLVFGERVEKRCCTFFWTRTIDFTTKKLPKISCHVIHHLQFDHSHSVSG
jgi:hypothetical protein